MSTIPFSNATYTRAIPPPRAPVPTPQRSLEGDARRVPTPPPPSGPLVPAIEDGRGPAFPTITIPLDVNRSAGEVFHLPGNVFMVNHYDGTDGAARIKMGDQNGPYVVKEGLEIEGISFTRFTLTHAAQSAGKTLVIAIGNNAKETPPRVRVV